MFTCDEKMFVLLGIFQPHIQYLLCLATPVDIVLLGVSFSRPYDGMIPFFFLFLYKKKVSSLSIQCIENYTCNNNIIQTFQIFNT